jgi:hypothetical protein
VVVTPISDPALFTFHAESGQYIPANRVATTLCSQLSRRWANKGDILTMKSRGYRTLLQNGEEIKVELKA